jgi:two-component system, OmpR family, sensor histidine kinase NblS
VDVFKYIRRFTQWWRGFSLQTQLLAVATVVIVGGISGFTFYALNIIQEDARQSDRRFGESVGQLLAVNAAPLIQSDNIVQLRAFTQKFLEQNQNILYIIYTDKQGNIYDGSPFDKQAVNQQALLPRKWSVPQELPSAREHLSKDNVRVTDIFYPISFNEKLIGVVALGINPNTTLVGSSRLAVNVTFAVGIAVAVILLLGAVFNIFTIMRPLKELVAGVRGISQGKFQQRITLPFGGELGELIRNFNTMAERLQHYEAQNIEQMTAEKARLETLITTIADGALLLDPNLTVILVNPACERILQWQHNTMGSNLLDRLPVGLRSEVEDSLVKVASGELELAECRVLLDNPRRTVRVLMSPVLKGKDLGGVVLTIQDISREAELNEAKSRFISNVSHELRTPLHCIKSHIETLRDFYDELDEETKREFLETTNSETDRLTRLVNDVLDLSRLESGREYPLEPLDLAQPIEQTLRVYQLNAQEKHITLIKELDPELPLVTGNYDLINQLLANLVGNALKFTQDGGSVTLSAKVHGDQVYLAVKDTGIGIAPEDQKKIFDRFFRVEDKVHIQPGTGLGLSIVSNIAEKHFTRIHISSDVGKGTTFWLELNICAEVPALVSPEKV